MPDLLYDASGEVLRHLGYLSTDFLTQRSYFWSSNNLACMSAYKPASHSNKTESFQNTYQNNEELKMTALPFHT